MTTSSRVKTGPGIKVGPKSNHGKKEKRPSSIKATEPANGEDGEIAKVFEGGPNTEKYDPSSGENDNNTTLEGMGPSSEPPVGITVSEPPAVEIGAIEKRRGNYILTLGYPGCGKTVFQSFLYYFIATEGEFSSNLEKKQIGEQPNYISQNILNTWLENWKDGILPKRNPELEQNIREVRLMVIPRLNPKRKFNFSFLEISGELIKSIVPSEIQAGTIPDTLRRFLLAQKSQKIIVYIFDHNKSNDSLFKSILEYIRNIVGSDLDKYYSLIIVVPNPELVLRKVTSDERYQCNYYNDKDLTRNALLDYLRKEAPLLVNEWRNWKKNKRAIYKFYIGQISKTKKVTRFL